VSCCRTPLTVITGRGIAVYGTITILGDKDSPISTYVIDDDTSRGFRFVGEQVDRIQRLTNFYTSPTLEYGQHVLTVTNEGTNATLFLDWFEVSGFNDPGTSTSPSASSSTPNLPSPSDSTPDPGQSSNAPSPQSSSRSNPLTLPPNRSSSQASGSITSGFPQTSLPGESSQRSTGGPPVGAIVGGVVGGIAILCAAFIVFFLCKRRHRRKAIEQNMGEYPGPHMQPGTLHNTTLVPVRRLTSVVTLS
jgi:hypothetical protein